MNSYGSNIYLDLMYNTIDIIGAALPSDAKQSFVNGNYPTSLITSYIKIETLTLLPNI
jgi:hypothetical protein